MGDKKVNTDKQGNEIVKEGVFKKFGEEKKHKKIRPLRWLIKFLGL